MRTGWLLVLDEASLRLIIGFITEHCGIRPLRGICNRFQLNYCRLNTIEHLLYNCSDLSKLRLRTLGRGFFKCLNSVSRADIKALHRFISLSLRCLKSSRASRLHSVLSFFICFFGVCYSYASHSSFPTSTPFSYHLYYPSF